MTNVRAESVELEIPIDEEELNNDINFLPPPPPNLLSFPSSDTPDLPDSPSDSECTGHRIELVTELPEPPKEEELRLIESSISEDLLVPTNTAIGNVENVESQVNDASHTIPSLTVPHFEASDRENSSVPSESKIHLATPSVPVQLSRSSPMSKPTAVVKPCKTSELNTTKEANKPYQAYETEATGKSADLAVSPAGIACTVQHSQVISDIVVKDTVMESDEDLPVVPAKGYNLDFLDQLDDPNFNHFETKTAIKNQFEASEYEQESTESVPETNSAVSNTSEEKTPKEVASTASDAQVDNNIEKTKPAAKQRKPLIRRNIKPKKPVEQKKPVEPVEDANDEDNTPLPPAKNYNRDILDKLDDPNFNPFKIKMAVKNQFDASEPGSTEDQASENKENIIQTTNEKQKEETKPQSV